jgi:hypothetical protein
MDTWTLYTMKITCPEMWPIVQHYRLNMTDSDCEILIKHTSNSKLKKNTIWLALK